MKNKKLFNLGDSVILKRKISDAVGLPLDMDYTVHCILNGNFKFPIVIMSKQLGEDWRHFVNEKEIELK